MKDYESMSDFEINKAVAACVGLQWFVRPCAETAYEWVYSDNWDGKDRVELPDYCNNPENTWPIILENGISVRTLTNGAFWSAEKEVDNGEESFSLFDYTHSRPLRAAMIVYLMMQDNTQPTK